MKEKIVGIAVVVLIILGLAGYWIVVLHKPGVVSKRFSKKIYIEAFEKQAERSFKEECHSQKGYLVEEIIPRQWSRHGMDAVLKESMDYAERRLEKETGYLKKIVSSYSSSTSKELAKRMLKCALSSETFEDPFGAFVEDTAKAYILYLFKRPRVKRAFVNYLKQEVRTGIISEKELQRFIKSMELSKRISGATSGSRLVSEVAIGGVWMLVGRKVSSFITQRIAEGFLSRIIPSIIGEMISKVIPLIGWGLVAWELLTPNTSLKKLRDMMKDNKVIRALRSEIMQTVAQKIYDFVESHSNDIVKSAVGAIGNIRRE